MGDMGDIFNDWREHKRTAKAERAEGKAEFIEWLQSQSVTWRILSGGYRFNIANAQGHHHTFDYWPGSGKWARIGRPTIHRKGERHLRAAIAEIKDAQP